MATLINDEEALRRHEEKLKQQSTLQGLLSQPNIPDPSANIPDKIDATNMPQAVTPQYDNNQAMLDDFITRPVTAQDAERRQKAATAVGAVGQLGNMISAFANLAGTAGGAASQQIPGYQGPDVQSWQDRTRQRQLEYAQIMNGLSAQDWEQEYKNRQLARQERLDAQAQANADRDFNEKRRQFDATLESREKQNAAELESLNAYRQGQVQASQTRADAAANKAAGGGSGTPNNDTISSGDYEYSFNRREGNTATWNGMYQQIPKEWLANVPSGEQVHYYDSSADMARKQRELIIRYANEHPEWMEEMMAKYPSVLTRRKIGASDDTFDLNANNDTFDLTK